MGAAADNPSVGIFWILSDLSVCHFSEDLMAQSNGRQFHDSELAHVRLWQKVVEAHKECLGLEYEEVPRGRILFSYKPRVFLAYVCDDFIKNEVVRKNLKEAFGLDGQKIKWVTDEHYNFSKSGMDPADIDDDY